MTSGPTTFVLINIFELSADRQHALIMLLEDFTDRVTRHMPGFVSATVHRGLDDTHVANYVRWKTREHFNAMLADPRSRDHMQQTQAMALSVSPVFYEVAYHCGDPLLAGSQL